MSISCFAFLVLLTLVQGISKEEINNSITKEQGVYILTEENFDDFINWNTYTFICFHNDNESMYKVYIRMMKQVAEMLAGNNTELQLGLLNLDKAKIIEARYQPISPPDMRLFFNAKGTNYFGGIRPDLIMKWLNKKLGARTTKIENAEQLSQRIAETDHLVVYFGPLTIDKFRIFQQVDKDFIQQDDIEFGYVDSYTYGLEELEKLNLKIFKEEGFQVRVYSRKNESDYRDCRDRNFQFNNLRTFIIQSTFIGSNDTLKVLNSENARKFFIYNLPVMFLFRQSKDPNSEEAEIELKSAFNEIQSKIIVIIADNDMMITSKFAALAGLDSEQKDQFPSIRILDPNPGKPTVIKYAFNKLKITKANIIDFVDEFIAGKLLPHTKTEQNPKNRDSSHIMPLNSQTFEQVALDKELDVFVLFTGSVCQLCEEIWPVFIQAAKVLQRSQNLIFASINMGMNELSDDHNIYYYPTMRYYPRDNKLKPYEYDQGLELDDIMKFVKRVATLSLVEDYSYLTEEDKKPREKPVEKKKRPQPMPTRQPKAQKEDL